MDHSVVQRWLRGVVSPYPESDQVYLDTDRTLTSIPSLSPKTEVYTYDDGRTQLLIQLKGTIPIQFRNSTYNIPIEIWIQRAYPREPPIVYVTPTSEMLVKKGKHVDVSGRVQGGYLEAWERKWEGCNLLSFIHDLQQIFGREPPVYAKPAGAASPQIQRASTSSPASVSSPQTTSLSFNPDPREKRPPARPPTDNLRRDSSSIRAASSSSNSNLNSNSAPPPPPKPGQSSRQSSLDSNATTFQPPNQNSTYASQSQFHQQPYPQQNGHQNRHSYSPVNSQPHPQSQQQNQFQRSQSYQQQQNYNAPRQAYDQFSSVPSSYAGPSTSGRTETQPRFASPISHTSQIPGNNPSWSPSTTSESQNQVYQTSQTNFNNQQINPPPLPPQPQPQPTRNQQDFLDSIDSHLSTNDSTTNHLQQKNQPPPQRPLNPELLSLHENLNSKLNFRLNSLESSLSSANSQLEILNSDLKRGEPAIRDEIKRLEAVRDVCKTRRERLEELNRIGTERFGFLKEKEEPEMEGIVSATSIVGNQLLDLVAEDNAIEDTIYHLGRALNSERIDLTSFLKQTRYLAREQFMRRALSLKIAEGMGWEANTTGRR